MPLSPAGELLIETLIIDDDTDTELKLSGRYAAMKNSAASILNAPRCLAAIAPHGGCWCDTNNLKNACNALGMWHVVKWL